MRLNVVEGKGVAGISSLGDCQILGMREDFASPIFGRPSLGRRAVQGLNAGLRYAFAGAEAVADAYADWLRVRAQPVPIYLTGGAVEALQGAGGDGVSELQKQLGTNRTPKPDFGAIAVSGAASAAAKNFPEVKPLPIRLAQGYIIGLAALCPE